MNYIHIDLFAGIGGNSLAFDTVFNETKNTHIFCEIDQYPRAVLRKHWPDAAILTDVRTFTADANKLGHIHGKPEKLPTKKSLKTLGQSEPSSHTSPFLLTGGFPCQPFSQAGRRKGTEDDRYLWPAMLRVIQDWKPTWVIAENVRGLVTWNDGMVLETVCSDLEREGYEVQPLIIPAVAVGAPHRRDRIWFVAHAVNGRPREEKRKGDGAQGSLSQEHRPQDGAAGESGGADSHGEDVRHAPDSLGSGLERGSKRQKDSSESPRRKTSPSRMSRQLRSVSDLTGWNQDWQEIAARLCGMDDGLPAQMDGAILSASAHRKARLKGLGNAIVPQVAMMIMESIKQTLDISQ